MTNLLKILGVGFIVFQSLAIAQEWSVFETAWFGSSAAAPLPQGTQAEVSQAVRAYLDLSRHVYGTGGDPRFLDRLPASTAVKDELLGDVLFLTHSGLRQDPSLIRHEVLDIRDGGPDRATVRTKEYWVIRLRPMAGGEPNVHSELVYARYDLQRVGANWIIQAWDLDPPPRDPARP